MADPLSIIASAITIGEVGAHLSLALFKVARTIKNARREIAEIAQEMSVMSYTLMILADVLRENHNLCEPELFEQIFSAISRFKDVEAQIKGITDSETRQTKRGRALKRSTWLLHGPKARGLLTKVESIKSALILALNIVQIASEERRYRL